MAINLKQQRSWQQEYEKSQGIESSTTNKPEACIAWFRNWLKKNNINKGHLLDIGCGLGRNSLPFLKQGWSVTAQDIVDHALAGYRQKAGRYGKKLIVKEQSLEKKLPYKHASFDCAIEITVADNLLDNKKQEQLWQECARVIKPGGYLMSYYFTREDGFYGKLLNKQQPQGQLIVHDPVGAMAFRFYSAGDIVQGSRGKFQVYQAKHYRYPGPMHGQVYSRDLVAVIFKRIH